ncbi:MAG: TonB-dependent receptor [Cyclobacteriaceae bacterium]
MRLIFTVALILACTFLSAQQIQGDTSRLLQEIVIEAYETNRRLDEVPASIGFLKAEELHRFNNTSILPAVNIVPGVRMEERSPGSYRFSIRGSSLRSPFGVRNVKAYWNGLPFTDGGGNTYLNLLDFGAIGTLEVIKGPGGSLYGAGTGGVLLIKSPAVKGNQLHASTVVGSYGLQRYLLGGQLKKENLSASIQFAHHKSDGYREQSALKRNALNADLKFRAGNKGTLTSTLIFSNLFYETPGGLTEAQFKADPSKARPAAGPNLGAVEAKAAVTNETVFGGFIYDHDWNNQWSTTTGLYGGFSAFENPTIRNYEDRDETNFGLRTSTIYRIYRNQASVGGKITFGGEYQYFISPINVFDNDGAGNKAAVQVRDEVTSRAGLVFGQGDVEVGAGFFITAGASVNFLQYNFLRVEPAPQVEQERNFDAVFSPRLAILKKFSDNISVFASYSDGFSPPSLAEVRPSTNTFSNTLKAESGNNLELGLRGSLLDRKLGYDFVVYDFKLRNTIVVQTNTNGADYFVNAGKTSQRGMEALVSYDIVNEEDFLSRFKLWASYAYQHYRFTEYVVLDVDFSGNALTGVAPTIFSGGLDVSLNRKFTTNLTVNYVDHIPLNDPNTAFAESYVLLGIRTGWNATFQGSHSVEVFAGIDNALDETYSLGNDLNAFGGRFYNAAMPRNYYAGVSISLGSPK